MTDVSQEITVVIPTLNRPTLERAVTSVVTQTNPPVEVILVSNGADPIDSDRLSSLLELAGPVPLKVLTLPPFSGPSISRNVGAWQATGAYVAFLDDDDAFTAHYLETMRERITRDGTEILYGAKVWRNVDGSIRREKRIHSVPSDRWLDVLYRHENPGFGGQNLVVRKSVFVDLHGFPVELLSGEDRAFAMAALVADVSVACVDEAEVTCYDPDGYRAKMRSDKWVTNLKLIWQFWGDVSWRSRLRSVWRWLRSMVGRRGPIRGRRGVGRGVGAPDAPMGMPVDR
jgi:glycosyltransferase involved in cell wall biosynthesis